MRNGTLVLRHKKYTYTLWELNHNVSVVSGKVLKVLHSLDCGMSFDERRLNQDEITANALKFDKVIGGR